ncbi:ATP-dependent DEAD/DEAH box RNA helicase, putative [Bodo saltans]|uniref:ATP-dependent DEAD/DEAH box RNA helicase, putative n=1 Tax=Bodo saltans TaxID=75058 RepID=A0A0S4IWB2_BODSA|nr:ATP-dependent DEAD/DEAH box RNA helicase, putative [Bodo saltans]|eukprot:CUF30600.1 ATP-dependent DEAD/DEAH box RNA helicase, putative [Bodo saltans]
MQQNCEAQRSAIDGISSAEFPFPFSPYPVQVEVMRAIRNTVTQRRIGVIESPTGTGKSQMLLKPQNRCVFPPTLETTMMKGNESCEPLERRGKRERRSDSKHRRRRSRNVKKPQNQRKGDDPDLLVQSDDDDSRLHTNRHRRQASSSSSSSSGKYGSSSSEEDDNDDPHDLPLAHPKVYFCSRTHTQLTQLAEEFRKTVFCQHTTGGPSRVGTRTDTDNAHQVTYPKLPFVHLASRAQLCIHSYIKGGQAGPSSSKSSRLNDMCKEALKNGATKVGRTAIKEFWRKRGGGGGGGSSTTAGAAGAIGLVDLEDLGKTAATLTSLSDAAAPTTPAAGSSSCLLCPFAQSSRLKVLKDYARASSRTLEELVALGKTVGACPFLASKDLVREANVVFLPYSYVVDPIARSQLLPEEMFVPGNDGDDLRHGSSRVGSVIDQQHQQQLGAFHGNVVVFDEAHHVADTARHNLCCSVPLLDLSIVASLLDSYGAKFESRLLAKNKSKLRELSSLCKKLFLFGQQHCASSSPSTAPSSSSCEAAAHHKLFPLSDLLFEAGIDHMNPIHLSSFFDDTKLVFKLPSQAVHAATFAFQKEVAGISTTTTTLDRTTASSNVSNVWTSVAGELSPFLSAVTLPKAAKSADVNEMVGAMGAKLRSRLLDASQKACMTVSKVLQVLATIPVNDCVVKVATVSIEEGGGGLAELQLIGLRGACSMQPVFRSCSSVLFAGGTLQPLPMLVDSLLPDPDDDDDDNRHSRSPSLPLVGNVQPTTTSIASPLPQQQQQRYDAYSFPHVIPHTSLRVMTLGCGPSGKLLEFTYAQRFQQASQLEDAARCVVNLSRVIPDGLIICFTSYAMEESFFQRAAATGLLDQLSSVKKVFREQRTTITGGGNGNGGSSSDSHNEDNLLDSYRRWIEQCMSLRSSSTPPTIGTGGSGGAVLSCVMGGKLSEGINFNDHLGRGVIVVGLPYPNPHDVDMKLLLNSTTTTTVPSIAAVSATGRARNAIALTTASENTGSKSAARLLYQQVCMRSVNQAMGRCIRHIRDYAVVVLLDGRYRRPEVSCHVAGWMQPSLTQAGNFGECFRSVREFFEEPR